MKRFLTLFLSLILSISALSFFGCKNNKDSNTDSKFIKELQLQLEVLQYESTSGIYFTDKTPMYINDKKWINDNFFTGVSNTSYLMELEKLDGKDDISVFERFVEIYDTQIKDKLDGKGFYFINTGSSYTYFRPGERYRILLFRACMMEDACIDPSIWQNIVYISADLPYPKDTVWADKVVCDKLSLSIHWWPVENTLISKDLQFEYCKIFNNNSWEYYVNIYIEEVCIGTCKIRDNTYSLPKEWYEWYFTTYLYRA